MSLVRMSKKENDLFCACINGNVQVAENLLQEGVNPNFKYDTNGNTLLMATSIYLNPAVAKKLIEYGANVNEKNNIGETALSMACKQDVIDSDEYNKNTENVSLLLNNGADINSVDDNGLTPLTIACMKNKDSIILELLKGGANVNFIGKKCDSALVYLCKIII